MGVLHSSPLPPVAIKHCQNFLFILPSPERGLESKRLHLARRNIGRIRSSWNTRSDDVFARALDLSSEGFGQIDEAIIPVSIVEIGWRNRFISLRSPRVAPRLSIVSSSQPWEEGEPNHLPCRFRICSRPPQVFSRRRPPTRGSPEQYHSTSDYKLSAP